jgi:hypothetical protein
MLRNMQTLNVNLFALDFIISNWNICVTDNILKNQVIIVTLDGLENDKKCLKITQ